MTHGRPRMAIEIDRGRQDASAPKRNMNCVEGPPFAPEMRLTSILIEFGAFSRQNLA